MGPSLLVTNLNPGTSERQLARFFSSAPTVAVRIPVDELTGEPRGVGLLEFRSVEDAERARAVYSGRVLGGRSLRLRWVHAPEGVELSSREGDTDRDRKRHRPRPETEAWREVEPQEPEDDYEDYSRARRAPPHRHRKHGSDRRRAHGARRLID